jgi:hypothetical protein
MNDSNNDKFSQHLEENVIKRKQLKEEKKMGSTENDKMDEDSSKKPVDNIR